VCWLEDLQPHNNTGGFDRCHVNIPVNNPLLFEFTDSNYKHPKLCHWPWPVTTLKSTVTQFNGWPRAGRPWFDTQLVSMLPLPDWSRGPPSFLCIGYSLIFRRWRGGKCRRRMKMTTHLLNLTKVKNVWSCNSISSTYLNDKHGYSFVIFMRPLHAVHKMNTNSDHSLEISNIWYVGYTPRDTEWTVLPVRIGPIHSRPLHHMKMRLKEKLPLYLIKHNAMKTYAEVEI
jgi:hypothetical protein